MKWIVLLVLVVAAVPAGAYGFNPQPDPPGRQALKNVCKDGGWIGVSGVTIDDPNIRVFRNQGACVSHVSARDGFLAQRPGGQKGTLAAACTDTAYAHLRGLVVGEDGVIIVDFESAEECQAFVADGGALGAIDDPNI